MTQTRPYPETFRRMLLDMHVPDWDKAFLSRYEPKALADLYLSTGVAGVLLYCKSHVGLNYWPAPVGGIHPAAQGRDLVGELVGALRERGIAPAAYHSVVFDNWAVAHHPEWAIVPASTLAGSDEHMLGARYGTMCVNQRGYRDYEHQQITALLQRYDFDAFWIDMSFWTAICVCDVCRRRFREEADGLDIPGAVDWASPDWGLFQAARERWLKEFTAELIGVARTARPGIAVTHNFGPATFGWFTAQKTAWCDLDTFAAGDIYGGRAEQLVISKLLLHLGERQPAEFMTSRTQDLVGHTSLKSEHMMLVEALGTIAHHSAFLFIDAIDPVGTVNEGVYHRVGTAFAAVARLEQHLGGQPVEDIAVYYSDDSRILPEDNGKPISEVRPQKENLRHLKAVTGAAGKLQRAHLPFGVITSSRLENLSRYRVVVLPDALRLNDSEVNAFRDYVAAGGRLYASGNCGLLGTDGTARPDFPLADVFGCHFDRLEPGNGIYALAVGELAAKSLAPERYLGYGGFSRDEDQPVAIPRLKENPEGTAQATLSVPYAYPSRGSLRGRDFASIHSFPPWQDLPNPVIVSHDFGQGRAVYSAAPAETGQTEADTRLFLAIIAELLDGGASFSATADPDAWITCFDQPEHSRLVISALVYRVDARPPVQRLSVSFRLPAGTRVARVWRVNDMGEEGPEPPFRDDGGIITVDIDDLDLFAMIFAEYGR
jgi:hypothetical protein